MNDEMQIGENFSGPFEMQEAPVAQSHGRGGHLVAWRRREKAGAGNERASLLRRGISDGPPLTPGSVAVGVIS
jgi:hypothetical protein